MILLIECDYEYLILHTTNKDTGESYITREWMQLLSRYFYNCEFCQYEWEIYLCVMFMICLYEFYSVDNDDIRSIM